MPSLSLAFVELQADKATSIRVIISVIISEVEMYSQVNR